MMKFIRLNVQCLIFDQPYRRAFQMFVLILNFSIILFSWTCSGKCTMYNRQRRMEGNAVFFVGKREMSIEHLSNLIYLCLVSTDNWNNYKHIKYWFLWTVFNSNVWFIKHAVGVWQREKSYSILWDKKQTPFEGY